MDQSNLAKETNHSKTLSIKMGYITQKQNMLSETIISVA